MQGGHSVKILLIGWTSPPHFPGSPRGIRLPAGICSVKTMCPGHLHCGPETASVHNGGGGEHLAFLGDYVAFR